MKSQSLVNTMSNINQLKSQFYKKFEFTEVFYKPDYLRPVIIGVVVIPISLTLWVFNILSSHYLIQSGETDSSNPIRWFVAIGLPLTISYYGHKKKSLSFSGAVLGFFIGFLLTLTSYAFMASLLVFFITSSWATKYKSQNKRNLEEDFKEGGQRNWLQVLCNGGIAAYLAMFALIDSGCGEHVIDLEYRNRQSWLALAILCAISCSNGDTWASEFGTVLTTAEPRLVISGEKVPRGTNGGVTAVGIACSAVGGLVVGFAYYIVILLCVDTEILRASPNQWPILFIGLFGGFFGSLLDSFLGSVFQYSGIDMKTRVIVEYPRPGVRYISGSPWLDNHSVNLIGCFLTAVITPTLAQILWY